MGRGLTVFAIAATLLAVGLTATAAPPGGQQLASIRHENPVTAVAESDPTEIFAWYLRAARQLATWQFSEGRHTVLRLDLAHLPSDLAALVGDVNTLLIQEGSILEATDAWLREAGALIQAGRLAEARPLLHELEKYVKRGNLLFNDAVAGIRDLAARTDVERLLPDIPQRRAYEDLQRVAARVGALLAAYQGLVTKPASIPAVAALLPYPTKVDLSIPSVAYPGRTIIVVGNVVEQAPAPSAGRHVIVYLDDRLLAAFPLGPFRVQQQLSVVISVGPHEVSAVVNPQDRYLGATARKVFRVVQAVPDINVATPRYAFAPGRVDLSGTALSSFGRMGSAKVSIRIGPTEATTLTTATGDFSAALLLPGAVNLVGPESLVIRLQPQEPWHAPVARTRSLFVINLVSLGFLAILIPVGGIAYARRQRRRAALKEPEAEPLPSWPAVTPQILEVDRHPGPLGELVGIYLDAVRRIESSTGLRMRPEMTLREFLRLAQPSLRGEAFGRLTQLAELAFYSAAGPGPEDLRRAVQLAKQVERELGDAA